jgi:ribosomal protein L18E
MLGCGSRQPAPPPPAPDAAVVAPVIIPDAAPDAAPVATGPLDQNLDRLAERSVALYADIAKMLEGVRENCAIAATKLDELAKTYADVIVANAKVLAEGREMQLKIALRRFDDQFQKSAKAIMQSKAIAACFQDPAFGKALDGLVGPRP